MTKSRAEGDAEQGWRILVVEDDRVDSMAVRRALTRSVEQVSIVEARSVDDGLRLLEQQDFDCALVDYSLPDGTAIDLVNRLDPVNSRELPILVLTGLADDITAIEALKQGVQDYLTKDNLDAAQLWRAIRYAVERKRVVELQQKLLHADRLASIGQLAAGVAHEINNPAGYILGNLDVMNEHIDALTSAMTDIRALVAARADRVLQLAVDRVVRQHDVDSRLTDCREIVSANLFGMEQIRAIIGELRLFARVEREEYEPIQLNDAVQAACNIVNSEIRHRARLVMDLALLPLIVGDHSRLAQVFTNLLMNAAQAIEPGAVSDNQIVVTSRVCGPRLLVTISDSGRGIPADQLSRIFEPFFTTKEREHGTGLGLSMCMDIIRKHKGDITITSEVGSGTRVEVVLPLETGLSARKKARAATLPMAVTRRGRILLVDDEP
ncbi:MAG: ATP-binding protein, partial [Myxococcota bacterium]